MIMPPGHQKRLSERRALTTREKWGGIATGLVVVIVAIIVVISVGSSSPKATAGCIDVTVASSLGSQRIDACHGNARSICMQLQTPGSGYHGETLTALIAGCRKAGFPTS
jgi:hypothetical protein